jgi:ParB family chromosome partitioning protein
MFSGRSTTDETRRDAGSRVVQELRELQLDAIKPNPSQPRRSFDEAALQGLADSIGERGVLQPVLVHPSTDDRYELVAGERRWRAARIAGLETIPALVSSYDDAAALEVGLIENMAREDLSPVEEARACATLITELGLTHEQVGRRVGRTRGVVTNLVRLLNLSEEILGLLDRRKLYEGHGRLLLIVKDLEQRDELARTAAEEGWSVRALEARVHEIRDGAFVTDDVPAPQDEASARGREQQPRPDPDAAVQTAAQRWGELLGVEVRVRPMASGRVQLEVQFGSVETAIALAERLSAAAVSR